MDISTSDKAHDEIDAGSVRIYARVAAVLLLISIVAGAFGEVYVPSKLTVSGDATATAGNISASGGLLRMGFAAYLLEALCDIGLTWIFYLLLNPVHRSIALLFVFLRLVSTATFAAAVLFYFAVPQILGADYLKTFSPDQVNSLALLALKLYGYGAGALMVFYGVAAILLGYLIFRSGYLPRFLGLLFALAGVGFVIRNFVLVLAPAYASDALLLPMGIAAVAMTIWLFVKGIDTQKFEEKVTMGRT